MRGPTNLPNLAVVLASLILSACMTMTTDTEALPWQPGDAWVSPHAQDHPLNGRIWDTANQIYVTPESLVKSLSDTPFILLGEKHDNADHHRIQAWLVGQVINKGRRMGLAFEMFGSDKSGVLREFHQSGSKNTAEISTLTDWQKSGWPDWSMYQPIAESAVAADLPVLAANLTRAQAMAMAREGKSVLDAKTRKRLRLNDPLPDSVTVARTDDLIKNHCNMLPAHMVEPMLKTQTAKDAVMADAMISAEAEGDLEGAILIAGAGHARTDWGVPWHLHRRSPEKSVISLGIIEVNPDLATVSEYKAFWDTPAPPFDYLWFTPRADDGDPCDKYAEQLKKIGKHN